MYIIWGFLWPKKKIKPMPEKNKFYFIHDGSKTGHPGLVVAKDDEANRYIIVRFDSNKPGEITKINKGVRHITKLSHTTDDRIVNSYVKNRPMLCKRKDIKSIDLSFMKVHPDDQKIIDEISKKDTELSPSLKKK